ncbi:MAG TPA: ABC transporter permease subunit [Tepidisphaeraceae bacterium]|nr:ABC transporter permease subunit [Tepidisphaeraceae bacterium]
MTTASAISTTTPAASPSRGHRTARRPVIPGFAFSLGYSLFYLSLLVLIPLGALVIKSAQLTWAQFWETVTSDHVVAAYRLSLQASAAAAVINSVFGLIVAWVLVRYPFPGRRIFDAVVDFPFALPTAVAGLTFGSLFMKVPFVDQVKLGTWITQGWNAIAGAVECLRLNPETLSGLDEFKVILMLTFVSLPFVIRTVQPVLQDWEVENEQAAASLGAGRWRTFRKVVFPHLMPAWLSGVALAFARSVGEYGSVIFVTGNIPGKSQIAPLQIMEKLDDFRYAEATAIAVVLLGVSLAVLLLINGIEWWGRRHQR